VDIGAGAAALAMARAFKVPVLLARFTRLLIDANRPLDSPTLIRTTCGASIVQLNDSLSSEDRHMRIQLYWQRYRDKFSALLSTYPTVEMVLSIHSFTHFYENFPERKFEIGVLYIDPVNEHLANQIYQNYKNLGYQVRINEPYSGSICDILYAANSHGKKGILLEFRQDLLLQEKWFNKIVDDTQQILHSVVKFLQPTGSVKK